MHECFVYNSDKGVLVVVSFWLGELHCAVSGLLMIMVLSVHPGVGSLGSSHWELMGDAMVTTEQVRLTPDMQSRQGAVWSRIVSIHPVLSRDHTPWSYLKYTCVVADTDTVTASRHRGKTDTV